MNYHRVVIQLLSLGISLTENIVCHFQVQCIGLISLDFLYQCLQEENGFTAIMEQMMDMVFHYQKYFIRIT
jgi:hypothetical protein